MINPQFEIESVLPYLKSSQTVIQNNSSSFYFAFSNLPEYQAFSIFVIYDYLRQLDDAADNYDVATFNTLVQDWQIASKTDQLHLDMSSSIAQKAAFVFNTFEIDKSEMSNMIAGQKFDLQKNSISTTADLRHYCYQVAGTVGCMIYRILSGKSASAIRPHLIKVGEAMQLTNILRDIKEDALAGKIYLPKDLLEQNNVSKADLVSLETSHSLKIVVKEIAQIAKINYDHGIFCLAPLTDKKIKLSLELAMVTYQAILQQIEENNFDVMSGRVIVSQEKKIAIYQNLLRQYDIEK
ncbi:phytoene/squalene synthase family protein [Leuconostoc pseudomesenteroides]|uniref:phytoene/squalene synthase family protein n=1 Tax=Leuconostoc pseudomesenteroides TaxID=33968 RepID=UPI00166E715F|nr:phytoene/squalene synthase family protein [Leuconostoc pseudomesenteroides]MBS0957449.1 phytoene/squalene synthase family protein [Leuconostoc pseudomesenteroides]